MTTVLKPLIVANWKMNVSVRQSVRLTEVALGAYDHRAKRSFSLVLCPSFENISAIVPMAQKTGIDVGAQDCFWETGGAYTGEVSPRALKDAGCSYVLLGHSERRLYLGETDAMIARKVFAAISAAGLTPVVCIGESRATRNAGNYFVFLRKQLSESLRHVPRTTRKRIVIAYEPLWAIGTGTPIEPADCARVYRMLKAHTHRLLPHACTQILYGGSVTAENVASFIAQGVSDGALIGGASSKLNEFKKVLKQLLHT